MKKEKIKLPDEKPFLRYNYSEYGGWGERFNGQELSILLKNV